MAATQAPWLSFLQVRCRSTNSLADAAGRAPCAALQHSVVRVLPSRADVSRRFLQAFGFLALLALAAGSLAALIAALIAVKRRVNVTIAAEDSALRGPDPVALLAEDVATLQADVSALGQALADGLRAVHDGLDEAAARRDVAVRVQLDALRQGLDALRASSVGADQRALAIHSSLERLEARLAASAPADVVDLDTASGTQTPLELQVEPSDPVPEPGADAAPAPDPAATEAPPKPATKSFLAFQLPSQAFAFDRAQRLEVVPSLSRVGFDAKSTLHDFSGATTSVKGELQACLARPSELCRGSVVVEAAALDTGEAARDEEMRKHLEATDQPQIRFEWTAFEPEVVDAQAMTLRGTARGRMSVRGVERDFAMPVRVSVDKSRRVAIDGEASLDLEDFGVPVPSKLGVISMQSEVKVWIALRLRAVGPATEETSGAR
jgi:polyisoprenoid-binding protein YceI